VLGLGNIGALASKPVMEGKAVLFKKFANIDCFDIELNEADPEKLAAIVCALEPTFGAINLEDIKAPDCFVVEKLCRERMNIPVFHDDQHGTAIVVGAATTNALRVLGKRFEDLRIVSTGGGAAGHCLPRHAGEAGRPAREHLPPRPRGSGPSRPQRGDDRAEGGLCPRHHARDAVGGDRGADMFLGLSGPNVLTPEMVPAWPRARSSSRSRNPNPEILPDLARAAAPGAIIATGRSDFPNQVNNVLCFPFIFAARSTWAPRRSTTR
jgi:malate dehydrogenase (oxaloacetate-decarboxylating)(NADP+)